MSTVLCPQAKICLNYVVRNLATVFKMGRDWRAEKVKFLEMPVAEKRKLYKKPHCTLADISTWRQYFIKKSPAAFKFDESDAKFVGIEKPILNSALNLKLADKVSVWQGDITTLEIDGIVNAANSSLLGGGGVDGAIHRAATELLVEECATLNGCETGDAKITGGYALPAKYVIHTVGPQGVKPKLLNNAYTKSLQVGLENKVRVIAFPSISTGVYGYAIEKATPVALNAVRSFLEQNIDSYDRVIFVVFSNEDLNCYERWLQIYFPISEEATLNE